MTYTVRSLEIIHTTSKFLPRVNDHCMAMGLMLKLSMNVGTCMMQKFNSLSFDEAVVSILSAYAVTKLRHSWHSEQ